MSSVACVPMIQNYLNSNTEANESSVMSRMSIHAATPHMQCKYQDCLTPRYKHITMNKYNCNKGRRQHKSTSHKGRQTQIFRFQLWTATCNNAHNIFHRANHVNKTWEDPSWGNQAWLQKQNNADAGRQLNESVWFVGKSAFSTTWNAYHLKEIWYCHIVATPDKQSVKYGIGTELLIVRMHTANYSRAYSISSKTHILLSRLYHVVRQVACRATFTRWRHRSSEEVFTAIIKQEYITRATGYYQTVSADIELAMIFVLCYSASMLLTST